MNPIIAIGLLLVAIGSVLAFFEHPSLVVGARAIGAVAQFGQVLG